jgi:hypothetical protein
VENDLQEIKSISSFKFIVVDIAKLMTIMYAGNFVFAKGISD